MDEKRAQSIDMVALLCCFVCMTTGEKKTEQRVIHTDRGEVSPGPWVVVCGWCELRPSERGGHQKQPRRRVPPGAWALERS